MIIVFYFFAHLYGQRLAAYFKHVINLPPDDAALLSSEVSSVMSIAFYSILLTAALEGALFGIAVSFMGYNGLLFVILFGFASLIPVVGGAMMWIPFSLYELSVGHTGRRFHRALYDRRHLRDRGHLHQTGDHQKHRQQALHHRDQA